MKREDKFACGAMKKVCRHCGLPASDHHKFEAQMPPGCICPPSEWGEEVLEVCSQYIGMAGKNCERCEHDLECHPLGNTA